ncbi:MAG: nucleotidyltransferase family protein [Planctomycetaceae bacterium]
MAALELRLPLDRTALADFCARWGVSELALFGSVLRDDFGPDSDVDVLVSFGPGSGTTLFDLVRMHDEMEELLGRPVDIVTKPGVERCRNPIRREAILSSARVIYDARP